MFGPPHYLAAPGTKHLQVGQLYVCALSRGIFAERVIQGPNSRRDYINSKHRHAEVVECRVVIIKSHGRGWRLPEPVACIRVCGPRVETRKIGPRSPNDRSYKNPPPWLTCLMRLPRPGPGLDSDFSYCRAAQDLMSS